MKGKAIFLLILVLFLGTGYLINYQREKTKKENTRIITTEMGDEFIITTDDILGKTRLSNKNSNFSWRIQYYKPDDNILLLCDTENVTIYSLSNFKFCKVKKYDKFISLESYNEDSTDIYKYLKEINENDKEASVYLKDYLKNLKNS
ncbi:hypothetical protein [Ruminococcus sp.]|uniref:hypothetical protein n=1 Tax=Ruminococcus sp. TaxID=41978 RepID=UPI0025EF7A61|nr:hypothetical protein [Ruminococcus sp.]